VVEGEAEALVTATAGSTRLAEIARLTVATPSPPTPLALELHRVVRTISMVAISAGVAFFAILLALGRPLADGFTFAVGVTVALVPEALLPTVTLALSWGAEQMARKRVLVRELEAVETLGSTTFICTDKTGTLTRNQMTVVEAWTPAGSARCEAPGLDPSGEVVVDPSAGPSMAALALAGVRSSSGRARAADGVWVAQGDPMEAAIDVFARRLGIDTDGDRLANRPSARHPFDPRRRRMSVVVAGRLLVKGAPDAVLPRCGDPAAVVGAERTVRSYAARGLRVLAVADRPAPDALADAPDRDEQGLVLLGLIAMEDPPRPDVGDALARCRRAGIRVAMITGDHPATAAAIAREVGLARPGVEVLVGADLPGDDEALGALLDRDGIVVARVAPEDKLRIARALRGRGHVVAMTGDGVNDGPALHEADIGIAMGASGTDVAREAADLVLLDDHFGSIVDGVELGRATYANMRRFLTYHLTDNVAELTPFVVWALSGGSFPLALGVLQILALDLGTDTLSAVALGAEPAEEDLLDGPPARGRLLDRSVARRAFGVLGPTVAALAMVAFVISARSFGWQLGGELDGAQLAAASGATFMAIVLAQSANAFACRSDGRWPGALGWTSNRLLVVAVLVELAFSLVVLLVAPLAGLLDHSSPPAAGWLVGIAGVGVVLGVDALDKRRRRA
jgi:magnesium-transporting ATPase (P-type)